MRVRVSGGWIPLRLVPSETEESRRVYAKRNEGNPSGVKRKTAKDTRLATKRNSKAAVETNGPNETVTGPRYTERKQKIM